MKKNNKKPRTRKFDDLIVDMFREDPEFLRICVRGAFENYAKEREIVYLLKTLRQAAEAVGMTRLSHETGISRQNLYHMLSEKGNPTFASLEAVLKAFGYYLSVKKIKSA